MRSIIIGDGEIGKSLYNVLCKEHNVQIFDRHPTFEQQPEAFYDWYILHICFGYDENFESEVKRYQELYKPKFTVVHSTTPVGTCRKLRAIHSPVVGQHPNLEDGIQNCVKMLSGEQAGEVADYFRRAGIRVTLFDKQEATELGKLGLTEYYRACIEFTQRMKTLADKHNLSFHEVYTVPNQIYNEYYGSRQPQFVRPILQPIMGEIGGHCVIPNATLISISENKK